MKKNILIDMLPFQHPSGVGGALSFTKTVYDRLFSRLTPGNAVFGVYDSTKGTARQYNLLEYVKSHQINLLDISKNKISGMIRTNSIDTFFIAFGQFYEGYDLTGIDCKTIIFIHDIFDIERCDNYIDLTITDYFIENWIKRLKRVANLLSGRYRRMADKRYKDIIPLYASERTIAYTVSEYSANALKYYFPEIKKDIRVCYSPTRAKGGAKEIENAKLKKLVDSGRPYLFMIAANRVYKNPAILSKVYKRLREEGTDISLVTLKYGRTLDSGHIDIEFLSDSDMDKAYQHALALVFPSFFEGFGYPPVEAFVHGTPAIVSNVTSIPEIVGDAAICFSPFYPADLYRAIHLLLKNPDLKKKEIEERHLYIAKRQNEDLELLIKEITE